MQFVHPAIGPFAFGALGGLGLTIPAGARLTIRIYVQPVWPVTNSPGIAAILVTIFLLLPFWQR